MVVIEKDYYKEEMKVKLTEEDIDYIIDQLNRTEHSIFMFFRYDKIIKKLNKAK